MTTRTTTDFPLAEHLEAFRRGAVDLIDGPGLSERIEKARALGGGLRIKLGMDPSSADLHFGHAVLLRKLRDLQDLGHRIVLIVGDATAMVGDPSGRNKLRPQLTREEVRRNLATYTDQAGLILDMPRTEVRRNSEWFDAMGFEDLLRLLGRRTVARTLEREDFQKRLAANEPIGLHELLYPLMQGWDSVMVQADVELGGTDQLFNLMVGRELQEQVGQAPQIVLTTPLINGLDGRKMSKSYANAIQLTDAPKDVFGKTMSIVDEAMPAWFELLTRLPQKEIHAVLAGHPRAAKARLAAELVAFLHGRSAADEARAAFDKQFVDKQLPSDIPEADWYPLSVDGVVPPDESRALMVLLTLHGLATSNTKARQLIEQGGVRLDGRVITDPHYPVRRPAGGESLLVQVGKRRFIRVRQRR